MPKRVEINLTFSANLDMVPGWGHTPDDWIALIKHELLRNSHYDTRVEIHSTKTAWVPWVDPTELAALAAETMTEPAQPTPSTVR